MLGQPQQDPEGTLPGTIVAPQGYSVPAIPYVMPPPQAQPPQGIDHEIINSHEISHESKPLINAVETGFADKKYTSIKDQLQEAIMGNDDEGIKKVHRRLADVIRGDQDFRSMYSDIFLGSGESQRANKMAGDFIINELQKTGLGAPRAIPAEEALHLGLIHPQELIPGRQMQESYGVLRDGGMQSLIPGSELSPFQRDVVMDRRQALVKGRQHSDPAGLQEFNTHLQALIGAHVEKNGIQPNQAQLADMIAIARGQVEKEPVKGGLQEKKLKSQIASDEATTTRTKEQTTTERVMRPHQITEAQAKTTSYLATAHQSMANAADAARKGEMAVYRAELEKARTSMMGIHDQMRAVSMTMLETDLKQEDKVKLMQYMLDLAGTGVQLSKQAGAFGLDFDLGRPNITPTQIGPSTKVLESPPQPTSMTPSMVNPFDFAPKTPGMPDIPQLTPIPKYTNTNENPELDIPNSEYVKLRRSGMSKEELAKKFAKKKAK